MAATPGQHPGLLGAVQDVTERHLADEALARARSELAHVSRVTSLGALTASIAHKIDNPLAGIVTNAGACLRMLAAEPPDLAAARETARCTIPSPRSGSGISSRSSSGPTSQPISDALVSLLTDGVFISMPPMPFEYEGRDLVVRFLGSLFGAGRRFDLVPTRANGQPAFGAYLRATSLRRGIGLIVLTLARETGSARWSAFRRASSRRSGCPQALPGR